MKAAGSIASAVAAIAVAGGAWWGWGLITGQSSAPQAEVFKTPERRNVAAAVLATGVVRLRVGAEVRVGSQLSGIVQKLNVVVGSKIKRGDVIAMIDSRGLRARLAQTNAQIAVAEQEVRRTTVLLERAQRLDEQKLIARSDVEDRQLELQDAKAKLEKARRDAAVVQTDLAYAVIRSPISGTVATVTTQEGETVAASFTTPTFATIIEDNALELVALVDETDIGNVAIDNPVTFTVEAFPAREFTGHVQRIAPKGTIISGVVNFEVVIRIDSPPEALKPDMTASVSIRTAERQALVVPSAAVQRDGSERFVYVEQDGKLAKRQVTVGTREGGFTEIRLGVTTGDRVLVSAVPGSAPAPSEQRTK